MSKLLIDRLSALAQRQQDLGAGETLFRAGDPVRALYLLVTGGVELVRSLPHGLQLILQRAAPGDILAEASLFADHYHCDAVAIERSMLRVVPLRRIDAAFKSDPGLTRAWARHLAQEVQHARAHAELLSLRTVAERVDVWLALNGNTLPQKGHWRQMASEIGTTPEALYRELAKRRRYLASR